MYTANKEAVHTTPGKCKNAAFFLRLGLLSTLIRHENEAFQKRSSNRRHFENAGFTEIVWTENIQFKKEAFRKRWRHDNNNIF